MENDRYGEPIGPFRDGETGGDSSELAGYENRDGVVAGDGDDDPIPEDLPDVVASEDPEFLQAETLMAMSEPERQELAYDLELFVAGGDRYADEFMGLEDVLTPDEGYRRTVPEELLAAEGVGYRVTVSSEEAVDDVPYSVSVRASRQVVCDVSLENGAGETVSRRVRGEEVKGLSFLFEPPGEPVDPLLYMLSYDTTLMAPPEGGPYIDADTGEPIEGTEGKRFVDYGGPLLTLDELQAIHRAIKRTAELDDIG